MIDRMGPWLVLTAAGADVLFRPGWQSPGRSTLRSRRSGRPGEVINRLLDKQVPLIAHYDAVRARPASDAAANAEGDRLYAETMQLVDQLQQVNRSSSFWTLRPLLNFLLPLAVLRSSARAR